MTDASIDGELERVSRPGDGSGEVEAVREVALEAGGGQRGEARQR